MNDVAGYKSKSALVRQQLADCNRNIAELRGRLKEKEVHITELRKLLREVCVLEDGALERAKATLA